MIDPMGVESTLCMVVTSLSVLWLIGRRIIKARELSALDSDLCDEVARVMLTQSGYRVDFKTSDFLWLPVHGAMASDACLSGQYSSAKLHQGVLYFTVLEDAKEFCNCVGADPSASDSEPKAALAYTYFRPRA